MESVVSRFLRYVKINTQSAVGTGKYPSTDCQWDLLRLLEQELKQIGLDNVELDCYGYLTATIPATTSKSVPVIAFLAHVDTSPDFSGKDVNPQVVNYQGGDITLSEGIVMSAQEFPVLKEYIGKELITTDGTTLLGADDKAGVAEIMAAAEYLMNNRDIECGEIRICFTPDEEVGAGVDHFDVEKFGAKFGYTMDGSEEGSIEYENFNAASATVIINGKSVHPGYAKGIMINSLNVAHQFHAMLPEHERSENTELREGFFHLHSMSGNTEQTTLQYIIRNHSGELFEQQKHLMLNIQDTLKSQGYDVTVEMKDQYFNMIEVVQQNMEVVEIAVEAMKSIGIEPKISAIRGGTDGARLSVMGLPCPNIFAGGVNYHGRYEFVSTLTMQKAVDTIVAIAKRYAM